MSDPSAPKEASAPPRILIVSGPSGVGKSSVCERLLSSGALYLSVSATTREPRGEEQDGVHYHYLTQEDFLRRVEAGEFLEWARVHGETCYGTLAAPIEEALAAGRHVLLDIDVQGADILRKKGLPVLSVLLKATPAQLRARLEARGDTTPEQIAKRLEYAQGELVQAWRYDLMITNDDLDRTEAALRAFLGIE
ncbi:MAG: guanylate kinase [Planctomycetes bacterium]|nr:guanylate kinase [Planctomycetota bacterium]